MLATPDVRLGASGAEYSAEATPIMEPDTVDEVVESFRARYERNVASCYPKREVAVEVPVG